MLFSLLLSLLGLTTNILAAILLPSTPSKQTQSSRRDPQQNISAAAIDLPTNSNIRLPPWAADIDPRFTYQAKFADRTLDQKSAYLNSLLALADLSTKGWNARLKWDSIYSFSDYGDVVIRIHASDHPSTLHYRQAIWGLYRAIRESSAHAFKWCVLSLYWSPILGGTPHMVGNISILGPPSLSSDTGNSTTTNTLDPAQFASPKGQFANLTSTTTTVNSTPSTVDAVAPDNVRFVFKLEDKPLHIDAIFRTVFIGLIHLSALDQSQRIVSPGYVKDDLSDMYLRWDASHLFVEPRLEPRHLISALSALPVYMYKQNRFRDVRFIVYVNELEVGRGWLYKQGLGGDWSQD